MTIDEAYQVVLHDPAYKFGANVHGPMTQEIKRFIVQMYEKAMGKKLLLP